MEREQSFQQVVLERLDIHVPKNLRKTFTDLTPFMKTNSKWVTDLNQKMQNYKTSRR